MAVSLPKARTGQMNDIDNVAPAEGRRQSQTARSYLDALGAMRAKCGRRRTPEMIAVRLKQIDAEFKRVVPIDRLYLARQRRDLRAELVTITKSSDLSAKEEEFIHIARVYGERNGLTESACCEIYVSVDVLWRARIRRDHERARDGDGASAMTGGLRVHR